MLLDLCILDARSRMYSVISDWVVLMSRLWEVRLSVGVLVLGACRLPVVCGVSSIASGWCAGF